MTKKFEVDGDAVAYDYIISKQKSIIDNIWRLAEKGTPDDNVKLKANCKLLDKILPDRTQTQLQLNQDSPIELLLRGLRSGH